MKITSGANLMCEHCRDVYIVAKPVEEKRFERIVNNFSRLHKKCKPNEAITGTNKPNY